MNQRNSWAALDFWYRGEWAYNGGMTNRNVTMFACLLVAISVVPLLNAQSKTSKSTTQKTTTAKKPTSYKYTLTFGGKTYNLTSDKELPSKALGDALVNAGKVPGLELQLNVHKDASRRFFDEKVALEAELDEVKSELDDAQNELEETKTELEDVQDELDDAKSAASDVESAFHTVETSYDRLKSAVRELSYGATKDAVFDVERRSRTLGMDVFSLGLEVQSLPTQPLFGATVAQPVEQRLLSGHRYDAVTLCRGFERDRLTLRMQPVEGKSSKS